MLPFVAQVALSSLLGLWFSEAFRSKGTDSKLTASNKKEANVAGIENALRLAHVRRMAVAGLGGTGHFAPLDTKLLEGALHDIAQEIRAEAQRFPGSIAGHFKEKTMNYGSIGSDYEIVGSDLMFGADDSDILEGLAVSGDGSSEIIGAELIGAARAGNPRAKAALRQVAMRNAGAVIKNDLKNKRRYPLGFVPTEVDSGDAATIPAAPQNLFRPERLVIPSDICFDFGVQDIKVGNQSQFAQSVEVPAAVFSEVSIDTNVTFDTAEVGNQISILVRNKGTTDNLEFTAAAIGTIAKA
jgi:hypothetical protein